MKKYLVGMLVFALGMQLKASDNVKVFNNNRFNEPVVSAINTGNEFDYLVVMDASTNQVMMEKDIKNQVEIHQRLDFVEGGAKNYTVGLVNKEGDMSTELEVVNNNVIQYRKAINDDVANKVKMFVMEDENLLVSYINGDENSLYLVIEDMDTNKRIIEKSVGDDKLFSRKQTIVRLKEGNNYRATLYSGQTAYYFDFVK